MAIEDLGKHYDQAHEDMVDNWVTKMKTNGDNWYTEVANVLGTDVKTIKESGPGRNWAKFMEKLDEKKEKYSDNTKGKGSKLVRKLKRAFGI